MMMKNGVNVDKNQPRTSDTSEQQGTGSLLKENGFSWTLIQRPKYLIEILKLPTSLERTNYEFLTLWKYIVEFIKNCANKFIRVIYYIIYLLLVVVVATCADLIDIIPDSQRLSVSVDVVEMSSLESLLWAITLIVHFLSMFNKLYLCQVMLYILHIYTYI